ERPLPGEVAGRYVDRDQPAPRWFLTRPVLTIHSHVERAVDSALLIRHGETVFGLFNPAQGAHVLRGDEHESGLSIERRPTPVRPAESTRKQERALRL